MKKPRKLAAAAGALQMEPALARRAVAVVARQIGGITPALGEPEKPEKPEKPENGGL